MDRYQVRYPKKTPSGFKNAGGVEDKHDKIGKSSLSRETKQFKHINQDTVQSSSRVSKGVHEASDKGKRLVTIR